MQRSLILGLLLALIVVIFALQNSDPIMIRLFFWQVESSVALIMTSVLFIGALLGILFSRPAIRKKQDKIENLEDQLKETKSVSKKKSEMSSPLV